MLTELFSLSKASAMVVIAGADAAMPDKLVSVDCGNQVMKITVVEIFRHLIDQQGCQRGRSWGSSGILGGSDTAAEGAERHSPDAGLTLRQGAISPR